MSSPIVSYIGKDSIMWLKGDTMTSDCMEDLCWVFSSHKTQRETKKLWIWIPIEILEGSEHGMCDNTKYK